MPETNQADDIKITQSLTPEETAIFNRVAADQDDWRMIDPRDVLDFSLAEDPFKLPPPALREKEAKNFAFRWITRDPKRLDQIRSKAIPFKWWICNRTNTPFLEEYIDRTLGCVCREDQMLVFKPYWMFEKEQAFKRGLADAKDASGNIMSRDGMVQDGIEMSAGKRSMGGGREMRQEVKSGDVIFGEQDIDSATGSFEMAEGEDE
jgi:hypothetical protein